MGMRNRRKQRQHKPRFNCLTCGAGLWGELMDAARRIQGAKDAEIIQVCGLCKTMHKLTTDGGIRLLTAAERFSIEMDHSDTVRRIEQTAFEPSTTPAGTIFVPPPG